MKPITDEELAAIENVNVFDSFIKARSVLEKNERVCASISGGSDSDVMLDLIERVRGDKPVRYLWFNTGVEYEATKRHLVYYEERYGITIERLRPKKVIPTCVREYGQPFISKYVSELIERLQHIGFKFEDEPLDVLLTKYKGSRWAIRWWCNDLNKLPTSQYNISHNKWLKEFLIANPPTFKISAKCCKYAKKDLAHSFYEENDIDVACVGIRKLEGGIRSVAFDNCYTIRENGTSQYRPLFWYSDSDKEYYREHFGIVYSDCYTRYGMKRTGCVGCPYGWVHHGLEKEHEAIKLYEPKLYNACCAIFRDSYEYTAKYREFVKEMNAKQKQGDQLTIDEVIQ